MTAIQSDYTEQPMTAARQQRYASPANFTQKATLASVVLGIVVIVAGGYASYVRLEESQKHTREKVDDVGLVVAAMRNEVSGVQREQAGMRSDLLNLDARMNRFERGHP